MHQKVIEQKFQYVSQNIFYDKNLESYAAYFAQHFVPKPTPQQCIKIIPFEKIFLH